MRKRWQIIDSMVDCLGHLAEEVGFGEVLGFVRGVPEEVYEWRFIHDEEVGKEGFGHPDGHQTFLLIPRLRQLLGRFATP